MTYRIHTFSAVTAVSAMLIVFAQETAPITGQWIIDSIGVADQVCLTLHRTIGKSGSSTNSSSYPIASLQGLTAAQMESKDGTMVHFGLVRDAGTLACDGYFKRGSGAGTFTFSPDPNFAAEMRKLGYDVRKPEQFFSMAAHNVSLAYVRDLHSLKIVPSSSDELVTMRIHDVSIEFIRELQSLGYANLTPDKLVTMRIHGVTPEFIRELKKLGYGSVSTDELVTMRIHGATTEFIQEMKSLGYDHSSVDQLVTS